MRVALLFSILTFWCSLGYSQLPKDFRTEQIHLGLRKTEWTPGDTLLVSGIVTCLAANHFSPYSKYLYIELLDSRDSVLVRQKVSCGNGGSFAASVPTERIYSGVYYLRAYTNLMRNFSLQSFAYQPVYIGVAPSSLAIKSGRDVSCLIYPTGGVLCPDKIQEVTASFLDAQSNPLALLPVSLLSETGDTLSSVKTSASGFAVFHFIPQKDKRYCISINVSDEEKKYLLPAADDGHLKVQCSVNPSLTV